jgi:RimJ/RimL family protein N-acetyltransferase
MNADPVVMEFFPSLLSREESDAMLDRFEDEYSRRGFCPWAVEEREGATFIGFVGLHEIPDYLSFAPALEVGWRLARGFWGRGFATEAAASSLTFAFQELLADEVVSMTSAVNERSRRVMERLGMHRDALDDFEHPRVPEGHSLRPHVLYRLTSSDWEPQPGPSV